MVGKEVHWSLWKVISVGVAVVVTTALVTGLIVAKWPDSGSDGKGVATGPPPAAQAVSSNPVAPAPPPPTRNRPANSGGGPGRDKTTDVLGKALIGGAIGAGVGAAGGAIAGGGRGAGKGAAIGGLVGATAGTLYGLQDNNKK